MSRDRALHINYIAQNVSSLSMLEQLLADGWQLEQGGYIEYLPEGDGDSYNWTMTEATQRSQVMEILRRKETQGESIGVSLRWRGTKFTLHTVFYPNQEIMFSLIYVERKLLGQTKLTDPSWYLRRIVPSLLASGVWIEWIVWREQG